MSLLALAVVAASVSTPASGASPSEANVIEAVLLAGLRAQYPSVVRWQMRPFGKDDGAVAATDAAHERIAVLRLGSRSAVRVGRKTYWYAVSGFHNVVSATRWTAAGKALDARAGRTEERDVLAAGCEPLTEPSQLNGMRARKTLHANEVLCFRSIEPRPVVARGEAVTVKYVSEHIVLTTKAVAQTNGAIGDTLLVRSSRAAGVFPAQVSGAGEVTIHE